MTCIVKLNSKSQVTTVSKELSTYERINSIPTIFDNKLSASISNAFPRGKVLFQAGGQTVFSYGDALSLAQGGDIKVITREIRRGKKVDKDVATIYGGFDTSSNEGIINDLIRNNLIEPYSTDIGGQKYYIAKGVDLSTSEFWGEIAKQELEAMENVASVQVRGGTLLKVDFYPTDLVDTKGTTVDTHQLNTMSGDPLYGSNAMEVIALDGRFAFSRTKADQSLDASTKGLLSEISGVLEKLGVSVIALDTYRKKYGLKHGEAGDVKALFDASNQIIALADGATLQDFIEEVSHLLAEVFNGSPQYAEALTEIESTEEFKAVATEYTSVYGKEYKGNQLRRMLQIEAMGKYIANYLLSKRGKSPMQSLTQMLQKMLKAFLDKVRYLLSPDLRKAHTKMAELVDNYIVNQAVTQQDIDAVKSSENVLFSLSALSPSTQRKVTSLRGLHLRLNSATRQSHILDSIERLINIDNQPDGTPSITEEEALSIVEQGFYEVLDLTEGLLGRLEMEMKGLHQRGEQITIEANFEYLNMDQLLIPTMKELSGMLSANEPITNRMREVSNRFADVRSAYTSLNKEEHVDLIVNEFIADYNIPEKDREAVRRAVYAERSDVTWLARVFGSIVNRANPLLQYLRRMAGRINTLANMNFILDTTTAVGRLVELGYQKYMGDVVSNNRKWVRGFIDRDTAIAFEQEWQYIYTLQAKALIKVGEYTNKDYTELYEKYGVQVLSKQQERAAYNNYMDDFNIQYKEQAFTSQYYADMQALLAEYPDVRLALDTMRSYNKDKYRILNQFRDPDTGEIDHTSARRNSATKDALTQISIEKNRTFYPFMGDGELHPYLIKDKVSGEIRAKDLSPAQLERLRQSNADLKVWGYYKIGTLYSKQNRTGKDQFYEELERLQSSDPQMAFDFLMANGGVGMTEQYYQIASQEFTMTTNKVPLGLMPRVENSMKEIDKYTNRITGLHKLHRDIYSPIERNYTGEDQYMQEVRRLEELRAELYGMVRSLGVEVKVIKPRVVTNTLNAAYYRDLETYLNAQRHNHRFNEKEATLTFLMAHMTQKNHAKMSVDVAKGHIGAGNSDSQLDIFIKEASAMVLSYYRKSVPKGYDEAMAALMNGEVDYSTLKGGFDGYQDAYPAFKYLQLNPSYQWSISNDGGKIENKRFDKMQGGSQFKIVDNGKFTDLVDREFMTRHGLTPKDFEETSSIGNIQARTNKEMFEVTRRLLDIRRSSLERKKLAQKISYFKLPEIGATAAEKALGVLSLNKTSLNETYRDFVSVRADDILMGDTASFDAKSPARIPVFFETPLQDTKDRTHDIVGALVYDNQQANVFEQRTNMERKILRINNAIQTTNAGNRGTLQMAQDYIDSQLYGKKVSFDHKLNLLGSQVNVAKVLKSFDALFRKTNLMFNPIVDFTGASTAAIQRNILHSSGLLYGKDSKRHADTIYKTLILDYIKETGEIQKSSHLSRLLELFQVQSVLDRVSNTQLGKSARLALKSGYGLSKISNLTNSPLIVLRTILDYKFVDGEFISYQAYLQSKPGEPRGQADALWEGNLDTLYSRLTFNSDGTFEIQGVKEDQYGDLIDNITSKIQKGIAITDGILSQEDALEAKRNPILNFTTAHRSWMSIVMENLFKAEQYNSITNQWEIGAFPLLSKVLTSASALKKSTGTSFTAAVREVVRNLPEDQKKLGKMALRQTGWVGLLNAAGIPLVLLLNAGDEDNSFLLEFVSYIYFRTASEVASASALGAPGNVMDVVRNPFPAAEYVSELFDMYGWLDSPLTEVQNGKYKGYSKLTRKISKLTLGKRLFDIGHIGETSNAYRHYNSSALFLLSKDAFYEGWLNQ